MYGDELVYWSVAEANRRRGEQAYECPQCGERAMRRRNDVNPEYRSEYNPGECVVESCPCGYYEEFPC
jgi:hypothetical protein